MEIWAPRPSRQKWGRKREDDVPRGCESPGEGRRAWRRGSGEVEPRRGGGGWRLEKLDGAWDLQRTEMELDLLLLEEVARSGKHF